MINWRVMQACSDITMSKATRSIPDQRFNGTMSLTTSGSSLPGAPQRNRPPATPACMMSFMTDFEPIVDQVGRDVPIAPRNDPAPEELKRRDRDIAPYLPFHRLDLIAL